MLLLIINITSRHIAIVLVTVVISVLAPAHVREGAGKPGKRDSLSVKVYYSFC